MQLELCDRVSFSNKILRQGNMISKNIMQQIIIGKETYFYYIVFITFTLFLRGKIFMRQGIHLTHCLCDRLLGME